MFSFSFRDTLHPYFFESNLSIQCLKPARKLSEIIPTTRTFRESQVHKHSFGEFERERSLGVCFGRKFWCHLYTVNWAIRTQRRKRNDSSGEHYNSRTCHVPIGLIARPFGQLRHQVTLTILNRASIRTLHFMHFSSYKLHEVYFKFTLPVFMLLSSIYSVMPPIYVSDYNHEWY